LVAGPENDLFANRITLTGREATAQGSTLHATPETGEPGHGSWDARASVWWTWTAPQDGTAIITATGSEWPAVGVYTGSAVDALAGVVTTHDSMPGRHRFRAIAGTAYHFALDHSGAGGDCALVIQLVDTPANDGFAGRLPITGSTASVTGTNEGAL